MWVSIEVCDDRVIVVHLNAAHACSTAAAIGPLLEGSEAAHNSYLFRWVLATGRSTAVQYWSRSHATVHVLGSKVQLQDTQNQHFFYWLIPKPRVIATQEKKNF